MSCTVIAETTKTAMAMSFSNRRGGKSLTYGVGELQGKHRSAAACGLLVGQVLAITLNCGVCRCDLVELETCVVQAAAPEVLIPLQVAVPCKASWRKGGGVSQQGDKRD